MSGGWVITASIVGGVVLLWVALLVVLWAQVRRSGGTIDWREAVRLVPDVVRLIRRLVADGTVPRAVRWWLGGLLVYLLSPIDLVPDVIPVLGYADDAIVVVIALRFALRHAGRDALERHWPGTPAGLDSVLALVGRLRTR
ncbi:uncharacterized membrane protein YkvA (DUF1232 family) [Microbacterium sp. SORGH_AS 505]|uniref:YkvA family protein n=1 Tax=Microbacterium sp. SORGH_AS_0505 TaxID=3041770 RepID=UPI0027843563|nr:DUF1232 domain-containing protein [Microbacterium sp. SORGH_AS_0505]MDQ1127785.1 uncharacterized membrane protein YkvA (DUF1232 family) [Microbacterium sp. SORGH_AS_0505]